MLKEAKQWTMEKTKQWTVKKKITVADVVSDNISVV